MSGEQPKPKPKPRRKRAPSRKAKPESHTVEDAVKAVQVAAGAVIAAYRVIKPIAERLRKRKGK